MKRHGDGQRQQIRALLFEHIDEAACRHVRPEETRLVPSKIQCIGNETGREVVQFPFHAGHDDLTAPGRERLRVPVELRQRELRDGRGHMLLRDADAAFLPHPADFALGGGNDVLLDVRDRVPSFTSLSTK